MIICTFAYLFGSLCLGRCVLVAVFWSLCLGRLHSGFSNHRELHGAIFDTHQSGIMLNFDVDIKILLSTLKKITSTSPICEPLVSQTQHDTSSALSKEKSFVSVPEISLLPFLTHCGPVLWRKVWVSHRVCTSN